jgi:hypothetical protein
MISHLTLKDVGPAREMEFAFAPRLNVLTGDNGLGKTFVLDVLWWVLTTTWAGRKAFPWRARSDEHADPGVGPIIKATLAHNVPNLIGAHTGGGWDWRAQDWRWLQWEPTELLSGMVMPQPTDAEAQARPKSIVVYARTDGSFAVWDSYFVKGGMAAYAESAIILRNEDVWDGKDASDARGKRTVIRGLIADWVAWQQSANAPEFALLVKVLATLSPPGERLKPGQPTRVDLDDRRDIPTLDCVQGVVPVTLASAGMKRALALAYLLVWAWTEHAKAAQAIKREPTRDIVLLLDEPELHLHPGWQRTFVPAVLNAVGLIAPNASVQMFTATHSPLVLASLESVWVEESDDLFVLELDGTLVRANEQEFVREGDVTAWLASRVFGGVSGRSRGAELAIDAAQHFMAGRSNEAEHSLRALYLHLDEQPRPAQTQDADLDILVLVAEEAYGRRPLAERVHDALKHTLPGHDEFWVHWTLVYRPGRRRKEGDDAAR